MTRINCVDPSMLSDKHLVAEYAELPRVFRLVLTRTGVESRSPAFQEARTKISRLKDQAKWLKATHRTYTMGYGHLKFFYTRCGYLKKRYVELYKEMLRRGMRPRASVVRAVLVRAKFIDKDYCGDWEPTPEDWAKNIKRLKERDPRFYRKF